jgi:plasmid maintenance system antidote protein VapI
MRNGNSDAPVPLGDWLKNKLADLGWMQKTLAERSRVPASSITELIQGKQRLSAETAEKLASVTELQTTAIQLLRMAGELRQAALPGNALRETALDLFDKLNDDGQEMVLDFMAMLYRRGKSDGPKGTKSKKV